MSRRITDLNLAITLEQSSVPDAALDITADLSSFDFSIGPSLLSNDKNPVFALANGQVKFTDYSRRLTAAQVRSYDRVYIRAGSKVLAMAAIIKAAMRQDRGRESHSLQIGSVNDAKRNTEQSYSNPRNDGDQYIPHMTAALGIICLEPYNPATDQDTIRRGTAATGTQAAYRLSKMTQRMNWFQFMGLYQWFADGILTERETDHQLLMYNYDVDTRSPSLTITPQDHVVFTNIQRREQFGWRRDYQQVEVTWHSGDLDETYTYPANQGWDYYRRSEFGRIPLTWPDFGSGFNWYHTNTNRQLFHDKLYRYGSRIPIVVQLTIPLLQRDATKRAGILALRNGDMVRLDFSAQRQEGIEIYGDFVLLRKRISVAPKRMPVFVLEFLQHEVKYRQAGLPALAWKGSPLTWKGKLLHWKAA